MTSGPRPWGMGLSLLAGLCAAGTVPAQPPTPRSFALRAKAIWPVTAEQIGPIERGVLIVRDGKIAALGANLPIPPDLPIFEFPDEHVCPGFVDAGAALVGPHTAEFSVSAAYDAADAFDRFADYRRVLARGTTTAHVNPGGHRLVAGRSAVVKLAGAAEQRLLKRDADLAINLGVFDPPEVVRRPFYASADVMIEPPLRQRPDSRLGQFLELNEQIARANQWLKEPQKFAGEKYDLHARSFAAAWSANLPLRVQVREAADIEGALRFIAQHKRAAYLVGVSGGAELASALLAARLPVVLRLEQTYRAPGPNLGPDDTVFDPPLSVAGALAEVAGTGKSADELKLALAGGERDWGADLRMIAALARRGGMSREQALAAVTRIPAEILGVGGRVGSLAPGKDADFLVLSGAPLEIDSHVRRAFVNGQLAVESPAAAALVIKAGTVWVGNGEVIQDGAVLIEDGKIRAVGRRVPVPPGARCIDAGPHGFVTPGFIDAQGHLGLEGDTMAATPDVALTATVGAADFAFQRVAQAGTTTVLLAAYRSAANGSRVAAIKTFGPQRDGLVLRDLAGVKFELADKDPLTGIEGLRKTLEAARAYEESWKKYEAELAQWEKDRAAGVATKPKTEESTQVEKSGPDPITGTWEFKLGGAPMPQEVTGTMLLRLTGATIEGRITAPGGGDEAVLTGRLDGQNVTLEIDQDTPVGRPTIRTVLDREDHMEGNLEIADFKLGFSATRTDKAAVEFKISRKKKRSKSGKPAPPKVDENLEPLRLLLAGKVPAVITAESAAQITAALKLFVDDFKIPLVVLGGDDAADIVGELTKRREQVGVVVPPEMVRWRKDRPYTQSADLAGQGVPIALQSGAEDGARSLPLMALFAVQQGLGGDAALRALTSDAARMYRIDDRVGSLEAGKDGDVLVYQGHPFDADGRLERVIVGGQEVGR